MIGTTYTNAERCALHGPWAADIGSGVVVLDSALAPGPHLRTGALVLGGRQEAEQLRRNDYGMLINCSVASNINHRHRHPHLEKKTNE